MEAPPRVSVVIPVFNERENLEPLLTELDEVLKGLGSSYEVIFVDDGSRDGSADVLMELMRRYPRTRVIRFTHNSGQTAAFDAGFKASRGEIVVTMDGDLQNNPRDIPGLLERMGDYDLVCGWREKRNDSFVRKASSVIANAVRNALSDEDVRDTGCSLKAFRGDYVRRLALFNGMHRFFPTLMKMQGARVTEVPVDHRPRTKGVTKYNIRNRMVRSFVDLLAVRWMKKRLIRYEAEELRP